MEVVEGYTFEQVLSAVMILLAVLLAICGAIVTVGKAVEVIRSWRKPAGNLRKEMDKHMEFFAADKQRLDRHDSELLTLSEGQKVSCIALIALLEHELHNGNTEEMQEASKRLNEYLINR